MPADALLRALLPPEVIWHALALDADMPEGPCDLHPEEAEAVARAVPKRRREFAAGRHCARVALARLCGYRGPVPVGADRTPRWPLGVVGSITHDDGLCAAAVARHTDFAGLGIDVELVARFGPEHEATICTAGERARLLGRLHGRERAERLALVFSAKEAVYKAQYPLTRAWLDFADLELTLPEGPAGAFGACLQRPVGRFAAGHVFTGGCAIDDARVGAALLLPASVCA